ncbi:MAG: GNAT family N-acetyltransferase [Pseudomonadota bacterium]
MAASKLIRPVADYKDSFLAALMEYQSEGFYGHLNIADLNTNFDGFIDGLRDERQYPQHNFQDWVEPVPETVLWMVKDGEYYGSVNIRHRLNWHLEKWGGHLTFIIRPTLREKGFGKKILQKSMPYVNYIGIDRALLTVDPQNAAATRIIEFCGGEFDDELPETEQFPARKRYWLTCE